MKIKRREKEPSFSKWLRKETKWHRWFAWYPVRVDDEQLVWLGYVEHYFYCGNARSEGYRYRSLQTEK